MNYLTRFIGKIKQKKPVRRLSAHDAYALWSESYDEQPDNVVLYLEGKMFGEIIYETSLKDKIVLDYGCGTGRHWNLIQSKSPARLTGVDISEEMLELLKKKYDKPKVYLLKDNRMNETEDSSVDVLISTLTIGHISDLQSCFTEWNRVLKPGSKIIITDFHPEAFGKGMKRSFPHNSEIIEVENYHYDVDSLFALFNSLGWMILRMRESKIDDEVKFLFEKQNFMNAFDKYAGTPLILGLEIEKSAK